MWPTSRANDILGVDQTSLLEPADIDGDTHICTKYSVRGITYYALDDIDPATASYSCRPHFGPASAGTTYIADDHNGNGVICSRMIYLDTGGVQVGGGINNAVLLIHDDSEGRDVH